MPPFLRSCLCALVLATASAACTSCDETSSSVRYDYVQHHRESFVYEIPRDQVLAALRDLLADKGMTLADAPAGATTLHTTPARAGSTSDEYSVHLLPLRSGGMMVQLVLIARDDQGKVVSSLRDEELEWQLVQRAEPDRALAIMNSANQRADHVAPRAHRLP